MRIMFFSKSKPHTCKLLQDMIREYEVLAVICKDYETLRGTEMEQICRQHDVEIISNNDMYQRLEEKTLPKPDLVWVDTYGRKIKKELLDFAEGRCINVHTAPLPAFKGAFTYNFAILEGVKEWGVTAHFVTEEIDAGDIIEIERFPIDSERVTVKEIVEKSQNIAYKLAKRILNKLQNGERLERVPQETTGRYYSRAEFEAAKQVYPTDSAKEVKKKIRAFWYPPYEGAYVIIGGEKFQLLPNETLPY